METPWPPHEGHQPHLHLQPQRLRQVGHFRKATNRPLKKTIAFDQKQGWLGLNMDHYHYIFDSRSHLFFSRSSIHSDCLRSKGKKKTPAAPYLILAILDGLPLISLTLLPKTSFRHHPSPSATSVPPSLLLYYVPIPNPQWDCGVFTYKFNPGKKLPTFWYKIHKYSSPIEHLGFSTVFWNNHQGENTWNPVIRGEFLYDLP